MRKALNKTALIATFAIAFIIAVFFGKTLMEVAINAVWIAAIIICFAVGLTKVAVGLLIADLVWQRIKTFALREQFGQ